ncbi:MAG TPA: PepSY domain-containing protein [Kofleriaceae bacterium]|nr:PepSY domain-containing protein [Kofleriaceae bacterium]
MRWLIATVVLAGSLHTAAAAAPKVSEAKAKQIALAKVPGTVVHEKLEHSKKKKHDRWNVKITPKAHPKAGMVKKVEIDADTGAVLKVKDAKAKDD